MIFHDLGFWEMTKWAIDLGVITLIWSLGLGFVLSLIKGQS